MLLLISWLTFLAPGCSQALWLDLFPCFLQILGQACLQSWLRVPAFPASDIPWRLEAVKCGFWLLWWFLVYLYTTPHRPPRWHSMSPISW